MGLRIRAAFDDVGHALPETPHDLVPRLWAALVLNGVVQQRRNGLVLVSAVFNDEGRDGER